MKIITLVENLVYSTGLSAEHGLSFYIDTGFHKIIFDTGQSDIFLKNAEKLSIDINDVDYVVISHGHYDHTGGLYHFLNNNSKSKIIAKKEIFVPKYSRNSKYIGTEYKQELIENRIEYVDNVMQLDDFIYVIPNINIYESIDTNFAHFQVKKGNSLLPDLFEDELFIVLIYENKINIITSCSHRGVTNICKTATEIFNLPVNMVLGGFHIKESNIEQVNFIISYLNQLNPLYIGVSHCTGVDKYVVLKEEINSKVFYNFTGNEINFPKQ